MTSLMVTYVALNDEMILEQDERGDKMYIILVGSVNVLQR